MMTPEEKKFIRKTYKEMLYKDIADHLNVGYRAVTCYLNKIGLKLSSEERVKRCSNGIFKKGMISWNKGIKMKMGANRTSFEKGNKPHNTKPAGTISARYHLKRNDPPYLWIKISDSNWIMLHTYNWQLKHGAIPKNKILRFKDGDTMNCDLANLELVTRAQHLAKNRPEIIKDLVLTSDRYIAARIGIMGKENQDLFIKQFPKLIEIKRQQLLLRRVINETGRTPKKHGKQNLDVQRKSSQVA